MFTDKKVKLYVNWKANEILNEKEFEAKIDEEVQEKYEDSEYFSDYLKDTYYDFSEVFFLKDEDKEEIIEKFKVDTKDKLIEELLYMDWEEIEVEIILE